MDEPKHQFQLLRPACVAVMQNGRRETIRALHEVVASLPSLHPHLLEYVALPIRTALHQLAGSDSQVLEEGMKCLSVIIGHTTVHSWDTFVDLYNIVCLLLDDMAPDNNKLAGKACNDEELCKIVLDTLGSLLVNCHSSVQTRLYHSLPMLGHGVSVVLAHLQRWEAKGCRTAALNTLLSFTGKSGSSIAKMATGSGDDYEKMQTFLGNGVGGEAMASFLPGICTNLYRLATSGVQAGQAVISLCLLCWAHYVALCASDDLPVEQEQPKASSPTDTRSLVVQRNAAWLRTTDSKLTLIASKLSPLIRHDSWRVQLAVVYWARCLLRHCHRSLPGTVGQSLEAVVSVHSAQSYELVSSAAKTVLDQFSFSLLLESSGSLQALLEERLYSLSSSLPATIRSRDDRGKMAVLHLVHGYLVVLGSRVAQFTRSLPHLTRLTQALLQTVKVDCGDSRITETRGSDPQLLEEEKRAEDSLSLSLSFIHIRGEEVEEAVYRICRLLGNQGDVAVLCDHLLEQSASSLLHHESFILLRHVLRGVRERRGDTPEVKNEVMSAVKIVVEEIVDEEEGENSRYEILHGCLLMAVIGECAQVLGEEFNVLVQRVIFPVVCLLGSEHQLVCSSACEAALSIARATGHWSIQDVIANSNDYLVDTVSLMLHHQRRLSVACHVLTAVIRYSSAQLVPALAESRKELLMSLEEGHSAQLIWPVLYCYALQLSNWDKNIGEERSEERQDVPATKTPHLNSDDLTGYFVDCLAKKHKLDEEIDLDEEEEEDSKEPMESADDNQTGQACSPVVEVAVDIIQQCTHHLSSDQLTVCLCVLDCLRLCLVSLNRHQDVLLPEVHGVWPAFLHSLSHSSHAVKLKSLEVLLVMSEVSRSFLRRRVMESVWPLLLPTMETLSTECTSEHMSNPTYTHTVDYKLQRKLLEAVGVLCVRLDVSPFDCERMLRACLPYLCDDMPLALQDSCRCCVGVLARVYPDRVWVLLAQLCAAANLPSTPHNSMLPIKLPHSCKAEQYSRHVQRFL